VTSELAFSLNPKSVSGDVEEIHLQFPEASATRFRLLWDLAPQTCKAVVENVTKQAECVHAIYSGTMVGLFFDPTITAPLENASSICLPGDIVFTHYDAGTRHGYPDPLTEIYWPYDRYARPTIPGQFITTIASVFASFVGSDEEWKEFAAHSRATRYQGGVVIDVQLV
jgi:hypothetical protein